MHMPADTGRSPRPSALDDELAVMLAARRELGRDLEPEATEAFLDRIEAAVADRVDADVAAASRRNRFTQRLVWSLGLGTPLVIAGGAIGGWGGDSTIGAVAGIVATLAAIIGLNAYYTEVEKDLELARLRRGRR
jgi:hypothetical protein